MEKRYDVVFDKVVKDKLQKAIVKSDCREIIKRWLDELEYDGPRAGKLLDSQVWLYEMKTKRPPLRLYYHYQKNLAKIIIFEFEMKTSELKQKKTINKLRHRLKFLNLFLYISFALDFLSIQEAFCTDGYA